MKAAVFIGHKSKSMSAANDISRYFYRRHPEYYAKIVNYDDYQKFDALDENYYMDLYVLELNCCEESDHGFRIAKRLRGSGISSAVTFIVPSGDVALQIAREMLVPSYIFLREAREEELHRFLDRFLTLSETSAFMEFTFQYKKWLVNTDNIIYIMTSGNRALLVCANGTMESTERMAELEKKLPKHFLRVDKGCLINTKRLQSADFSRRQAMFDGGDFVYMSRRGTKKLFDTLTD